MTIKSSIVRKRDYWLVLKEYVNVKQSYKYNTELHQCRGLVGANCQPDASEDWKSDDSIPYSIMSLNFCVEGAFCDVPKRDSKTDGFWKCEYGNLEIMNRTCA